MDNTYLRVFEDRSELVYPDGTITVFIEGPMSSDAKRRATLIQEELQKGYLDKVIEVCKKGEGLPNFSLLSQLQIDAIDNIVGSLTSEVGRALIGIIILQFCIKSIEPSQSIRLHKGGPRKNRDFSWVDGISMRGLDKPYITPVLRKHGLLSLNKDGFMMTRTLAENYPYSSVYKASIRGARKQWLYLVEELETKSLDPRLGLYYIISKLLNKANEFKRIADLLINKVEYLISNNIFNEVSKVISLMNAHMDKSNYSARIMEISMHSLLQARSDIKTLIDGELVILSQMRSANKKHGNIGDIEISNNGQIIQSWDAKYGISYLRDEIEELSDKLYNHTNVLVAGFVTSITPTRLDELSPRIEEIELIHGVDLAILTFEDWVYRQRDEVLDIQSDGEKLLANAWIRAYSESLAQRRTTIAPIDEPCYQWVESLLEMLSEY